MIQAQDKSLSPNPSISHPLHWFSGRFALILGLGHTARVCLVVLVIATLVGESAVFTVLTVHSVHILDFLFAVEILDSQKLHHYVASKLGMAARNVEVHV